MELRYNPLHIFRTSKSPAGLYARQKWLGLSDTPKWKQDYQQTVDKLLAGQWPAILRFSDAVQTITRLFGLHLTVRATTEDIDAVLARLGSQFPLLSNAKRACAFEFTPCGHAVRQSR